MPIITDLLGETPEGGSRPARLEDGPENGKSTQSRGKQVIFNPTCKSHLFNLKTLGFNVSPVRLVTRVILFLVPNFDSSVKHDSDIDSRSMTYYSPRRASWAIWATDD